MNKNQSNLRNNRKINKARILNKLLKSLKIEFIK